MDIPVQIPNATKEIVIQVSDPNTFWLVFVTLILAGITFFGILLSNKRTKESNDLLLKQIQIKVRPWITFPEPMPIFVILENRSVPYEKYALNPTEYGSDILDVSFSIDITNIGIAPTKKVDYRILSIPTKIERNYLLEHGNTGKSFPLAPQEKIAFPFVVPIIHWRKRKESPYYFGLYVEYEIEKGKIGKIGKIWSVGDGGISQEDYWVTDELLE